MRALAQMKIAATPSSTGSACVTRELHICLLVHMRGWTFVHDTVFAPWDVVVAVGTSKAVSRALVLS